MIIKRIPLFIVGLLYGAVINSAVLGLGYGIYAAGVAIGGILECCRGSSGCLMGNPDADAVAVVIIGIIILVAAAIGFAVGVLYGLLTGSWHCAMDFYNNGFLRGLSSPFRFLSAKWSNDINGNPEELRQYYTSTEMGLIEKRKMAQQAIEGRARLVTKIVDTRAPELKSEQKIQGPLPLRVMQIIAEQTISPNEVNLPCDMPTNVAHAISRQVLPADRQKAKRTKTAADFFTPDQTREIIRKYPFFSESYYSQKHQRQNQAAIIHQSPKISETLQLIRRSRY